MLLFDPAIEEKRGKFHAQAPKKQRNRKMRSAASSENKRPAISVRIFFGLGDYSGEVALVVHAQGAAIRPMRGAGPLSQQQCEKLRCEFYGGSLYQAELW
jgi:hypothetical protein